MSKYRDQPGESARRVFWFLLDVLLIFALIFMNATWPVFVGVLLGTGVIQVVITWTFGMVRGAKQYSRAKASYLMDHPNATPDELSEFMGKFEKQIDKTWLTTEAWEEKYGK